MQFLGSEQVERGPTAHLDEAVLKGAKLPGDRVLKHPLGVEPHVLLAIGIGEWDIGAAFLEPS